jgi:uncharacterized protein (DUF1015 family)
LFPPGISGRIEDVPRVRPFHGVRYDNQRVAPADVLAPPYDIVSTDDRQRLGRNRENVVHLELPLDEAGEGTRYRAAARRLGQWLDSGVLRRDPRPRLYPYVQKFRHGDGWTERRAVFGIVELKPPGRANRLHPHEFTLSGPREDRYRLLEATRTSLSPVFLLYRDPSGTARSLLEQATDGAPLAEAETSWETEESMWALEGEEAERLAGLLSDSELVFADGHHRYESALRYAETRSSTGEGTEEGHRFALAAFVEQEDRGLVVLPTHRVVAQNPSLDMAKLRTATDKYFDVESIRVQSGAAGLTGAALEWLADQERAGELALVQILSCAEPPRGITLRQDRRGELFDGVSAVDPRLRDLDVVVLQALLEKSLGLGPREVAEQAALHYTRDAAGAWSEVHRGEAAAFLVNPTPVEKVVELASEGLRMPQKTTYFHPKISSGWLFHVHGAAGDMVRSTSGNGRAFKPA